MIIDEAWRVRASVPYRRRAHPGSSRHDPDDPLSEFRVWVTGPAHRQSDIMARQDMCPIRIALRMFTLHELVHADIEDLVRRHPRVLNANRRKASEAYTDTRRPLNHLREWFATECVVDTTVPAEAVVWSGEAATGSAGGAT